MTLAPLMSRFLTTMLLNRLTTDRPTEQPMFTLLSRFTKDESTDEPTDEHDADGITTDSVTVERNTATVRRTVVCDGGENTAIDAIQNDDGWKCGDCDSEKTFDTMADLKRHAASSSHPAHADHGASGDEDPEDTATTDLTEYNFINDAGEEYRTSVTEYENGTLYCNDCDSDRTFDSNGEFRTHVEQSPDHSPIDSSDESGADSTTDGGDKTGFYDEEEDEFYEFPSDGPNYPGHIPNSRPAKDGLTGWLTHNWRILTNRADPLGIDWMKVHLRALINNTDNAFKQSLGGIGLAGVHYLDINRNVLRWTYKEAKKFGSSSTEFAKSGAKMLIGLGVFNQVTSWPLRLLASKLGFAGLGSYIPITVNGVSANLAASVAVGGVLSGAGLTSTLMAALPLTALAGLGAYITHDGFRETVKKTARKAVDTVKDTVKTVKDTVTGWFSSSSSEKTTPDAPAATV